MFDAGYTGSLKHHVGQFDVRAYRSMIPAGPAEGRLFNVCNSTVIVSLHLFWVACGHPNAD